MDVPYNYFYENNFYFQYPSHNYATNDKQFSMPEKQMYKEHLNSNEDVDLQPNGNSIPLPQDLTNLFKALECELCGVSLRCSTSAFTHYEGKGHAKNVNAYMRQHYNIYGSLKETKERFTPIKCEVCNIELTSKIVCQQHFTGKHHLKNVKKNHYTAPKAQVGDIFSNEDEILLKKLPPPPPTPLLSDYVCTICNISTNTEQQLNLHKNGQKHLKKLNKLKELQLNSEIYDYYTNKWPEGEENDVLNSNEAKPFLENPEMDCPLSFNSIPAESCNDATLKCEDKINEPNYSLTNIPLHHEKNGQSNERSEHVSLEFVKKDVEIQPLELSVNNTSILSSTGILLKQIKIVGKEKDANEDILNPENQNNDGSYNNQSIKENFKFEVQGKSDSDVDNNKQISHLIDNVNSNPLISHRSGDQNIEELCIQVSEQSNVPNIEKDTESVPFRRPTETSDETKSYFNDIESVCKGEKKILELLPQANHETEVLLKENQSDAHNNSNSLLDTILTKLALEEIEKESKNYGKERKIAKSHPAKEETAKKENRERSYKYDFAGFRINDSKERICNVQSTYHSNGRLDYYYYMKKNNFSRRWYNRGKYWNNSHNCNNFKIYNNYQHGSSSHQYKERERFRTSRKDGYKDNGYYKNCKRKRAYSSSSDGESNNDKRKNKYTVSKNYKSTRRKRSRSTRKYRTPRRYRNHKSLSTSSDTSTSRRYQSDSSSTDCKKNDSYRKKDEQCKINSKQYINYSRRSHSTGSSSDKSTVKSGASTSSNNKNDDYHKDIIYKTSCKTQETFTSSPHKRKRSFKLKFKQNVSRINEEGNSNYWNHEKPTNSFHVSIKKEIDA